MVWFYGNGLLYSRDDVIVSISLKLETYCSAVATNTTRVLGKVGTLVYPGKIPGYVPVPDA